MTRTRNPCLTRFYNVVAMSPIAVLVLRRRPKWETGTRSIMRPASLIAG